MRPDILQISSETGNLVPSDETKKEGIEIDCRASVVIDSINFFQNYISTTADLIIANCNCNASLSTPSDIFFILI